MIARNHSIIFLKNMAFKILLSSLLLLLSCSSPGQMADFLKVGFQLGVCPDKEDLHQDSSGKWATHSGDWKSDTVSFSDTIGSFAGAQWQGINFGEVICIYHAAGKATFPIALIHQGLVPEPEGYQWGPNIKGVRDCKARYPKDCPFMVEKPPETPKDIYKELDFFKGKTRDDL